MQARLQTEYDEGRQQLKRTDDLMTSADLRCPESKQSGFITDSMHYDPGRFL